MSCVMTYDLLYVYAPCCLEVCCIILPAIPSHFGLWKMYWFHWMICFASPSAPVFDPVAFLSSVAVAVQHFFKLVFCVL